ncbi:hypothetical protein QQ008_07655 [Fulvivirgaceae bacterium BMA10]|uniref:Uncharacterized protein n=1 Tax=Splendidivirga corallicola TaxID=3051826 RepID=A0ABT8KKJ0_9BACT|nr:hypothetical protein [Fulvivirgaceae bacterium BMA10]
MVRVVKRKLPDKHTAQTKSLLDLLAIYIADHPGMTRQLLLKYDIPISKNSNGKDLTNKVFIAIEKAGKHFHNELAKRLYAKIKPKEQEDSFDFRSLQGGGTSGGNGGVTIGADPVSAIAGAVGSIANLFGNKQRKKIMKDQARSQTLQTMLAYKAQKEAQVAYKQAAKVSQVNKEKLLKMVGGTAVIGIAGWFFLKQLGKQRPAYQPNYQVTQ